MGVANGKSVLMSDLVIEGDLVSKGQVEVNGRVQGNVNAEMVTISKTGEVYGALKAQNAEVLGSVQGDIRIRELIHIGDTGSVTGDVEYGRIAMEQGGILSATLRNVPPHLAGDFNLSVQRGARVRITTEDLNALDPDDDAKDLAFAVSNPLNGFVSLMSAPGIAVTAFTQADLENGQVMFVHDGSSAPAAGFDTKVTDAQGATSGDAQHVTVTVLG
ncbi:MAG: polymer-forming cytoskeletal protein [Filomicrobium sp.]